MHTNQDLVERIETLVRELVEAHVKETRAAGLAAVTRGLGAPAARIKQPRKGTRTRSSNGRRSPEEVSALAESPYELVCSRPGEPMVLFATEFQKTARELRPDGRSRRREP